MFEYIPLFITVFVLNTVAAASPGPDMLVVMKNSIMYSRKSGMYTALGITSGIGVHVLYSLLGVGILIAESPTALTIIKYVGASYLGYLGIKMILSGQLAKVENFAASNANLTISKSFQQGFITNLFNPKAVIFFVSLFTAIIDPGTPNSVLIVLGMEIVLATILWFTIVAMLFSHPKIRQWFLQRSLWFERITGVVLILLSINILIFHHI